MKLCKRKERIERITECIKGCLVVAGHSNDLKERIEDEKLERKLDKRIAKEYVKRLELQDKLEKLLKECCKCSNHSCEYYNKTFWFFYTFVNFCDRDS